MKRIFWLVSLILLSALLVGCGQKSAGLQDSAASPDITLFENGMDYLSKSQYIKARLTFQTLINTYPESEFTPSSFLAIADSFYEQGGLENLLQAEAQYKDFMIFYPTHEMADDAQLKIAAINYKLMGPFDRDPTHMRKAASEINRFLANFPDSEMAPTAREVLKEVREAMAMRDHYIGNFYFKRSSYRAAEDRYKEVLEKYPDFSTLDETLFNLGQCLEENGQVVEASVYYKRVASEFPFSDYFSDSKEHLLMLEQDVPEVDELLAAQREANRREDEGFSITDPLKSIWQTVTGRDDIYKKARKKADQGTQQGFPGSE
jgi:outer membrane protein assembly factor BamD